MTNISPQHERENERWRSEAPDVFFEFLRGGAGAIMASGAGLYAGIESGRQGKAYWQKHIMGRGINTPEQAAKRYMTSKGWHSFDRRLASTFKQGSSIPVNMDIAGKFALLSGAFTAASAAMAYGWGFIASGYSWVRDDDSWGEASSNVTSYASNLSKKAAYTFAGATAIDIFARHRKLNTGDHIRNTWLLNEKILSPLAHKIAGDSQGIAAKGFRRLFTPQEKFLPSDNRGKNLLTAISSKRAALSLPIAMWGMAHIQERHEQRVRKTKKDSETIYNDKELNLYADSSASMMGRSSAGDMTKDALITALALPAAVTFGIGGGIMVAGAGSRQSFDIIKDSASLLFKKDFSKIRPFDIFENNKNFSELLSKAPKLDGFKKWSSNFSFNFVNKNSMFAQKIKHAYNQGKTEEALGLAGKYAKKTGKIYKNILAEANSGIFENIQAPGTTLKGLGGTLAKSSITGATAGASLFAYYTHRHESVESGAMAGAGAYGTAFLGVGASSLIYQNRKFLGSIFNRKMFGNLKNANIVDPILKQASKDFDFDYNIASKKYKDSKRISMPYLSKKYKQIRGPALLTVGVGAAAAVNFFIDMFPRILMSSVRETDSEQSPGGSTEVYDRYVNSTAYQVTSNTLSATIYGGGGYLTYKSLLQTREEFREKSLENAFESAMNYEEYSDYTKARRGGKLNKSSEIRRTKIRLEKNIRRFGVAMAGGVAGISIGLTLASDGGKFLPKRTFEQTAGISEEKEKEKARGRLKKNKMLESANTHSQNMFNDKPLYA